MSQTSADLSLLDRDHLRRQTADDRALEGELLALFAAQCARLRPLLEEGRPPVERADAAHTLKGSARAIGAWRLAAAAGDLEDALRSGAAEAAVASFLAGFDEIVEATGRAVANGTV